MSGNPIFGFQELAKGTGTSRSYFQLDDDNTGPRIENNSGILEVRNATGGSFVVVRGATPVGSNDLTTKSYVDSLVNGADWQESVKDELADPPTSPSSGDRYLVIATATGDWTGHEDDIAEYNGSSWDFTSPNDGMSVWIEDVDKLKVYNGSAWVTFGSTISHNNTSDLQGGTSGEYYHLTQAQHTEVTGFFAATDITGAEAEELTDGSDTSLHNHDSRYYTETELDNGQLDTRYYTESETDTLINNLVTGATPFTNIDVNGGAIDGTPIGANSPSTGAFTTLTATSFAAINKYEAITSDKTLTSSDSVIAANTSSGAITVTLPDADTIKGKTYLIYLLTSGNNLTIQTDGTDTFSNGNTSLYLDTTDAYVRVTAVGANKYNIEGVGIN